MKTKYVQSIICLVIIFIFANKAWAADWKYYATDVNDSIYLYDAESIVNISGDTIQVWTKFVYSEKAKENLRKGVIPQDSSASLNWANWAKRIGYMVDLSEINCTTRTMQGLTERQYDNDGSLLDTIPKETLSKIAEHTGRDPYITPGSIDEMLYNVVCNKVKQDPKQKRGKSSLNKE